MAFLSGLKQKLGLGSEDAESAELTATGDEFGEEEEIADETYGDYPDYGKNGGYVYDGDESDGTLLAPSERESASAGGRGGVRDLSLPLISRNDVKQYLRQVDFPRPEEEGGVLEIPRIDLPAEEPRPVREPLRIPVISPVTEAPFGAAPVIEPTGYAGPAGAAVSPVVTVPPVVEAQPVAKPQPFAKPQPVAEVKSAVVPAAPTMVVASPLAPAEDALAYRPAYVAANAADDFAPREEAETDKPSAATRVTSVTAREMVVVKPTCFDDVELISAALLDKTIVILSLRNCVPDLTRRVLDFTFGAASVCGAKVDTVGVKVFAVFFEKPLNEYEILSLRNRGAL